MYSKVLYLKTKKMLKSFDPEMKCSRKLTVKESTEFRALLKSKTSLDQDVLDYTFAMVSNDKTVGYIVKELVDMELCPNADELGVILSHFLTKLKSQDESTETTDKEISQQQQQDTNQTTEQKKIITLKSTNSKSNALTMAGALGTSRTKTNSDDRKNNNSNKKKASLAGEAFQRLSKSNNNNRTNNQNSNNNNRHANNNNNNNNKQRNNQRFSGQRRSRENSQPQQQQQETDYNKRGGRGDGRGNSRDHNGRGRGGRYNNNSNRSENNMEGRGRGFDRRGGRGERDGGGRDDAGRDESGRGDAGRGSRGGRGDGGRGGRGGRTGRGGRDGGRGGRHFNQETEGPPNPKRIRTDNEEGQSPYFQNKVWSKDGNKTATLEAAQASPSPLVAASFGFRGGQYGNNNFQSSRRMHVAKILKSKTWTREKTTEETPPQNNESSQD